MLKWYLGGVVGAFPIFMMNYISLENAIFYLLELLFLIIYLYIFFYNILVVFLKLKTLG